MAVSDLTAKDLYRLSRALSAAKNRAAEIPSLDALLPAIKDALDSDGELVDNLVPVFGEPIRAAFQVVRDVIAEKHGQQYADDLWGRFIQRSS